MRRSQVSFLLTISTTLIFLLGLLAGWLLAHWTQRGNPSTPTWLVVLGLVSAAITAILLWHHRFQQIYFSESKNLSPTRS
ncbi:MAG: hypothetical protein R2867_14610 [Caldilineaceae bacterium]